MISFRRALAGSLLAALVSVGSGAGAADSLIPVKLSVIAPGTNYAQFAIAKESGLFEKNGLDVSFVTIDQVSTALAALAAKQVDFAFVGPNLVDAVQAGLPVTAVWATDNVSVAQVCASGNIRNAKDLIGKSVALPHRGTAPDITFRVWLTSQGVKESDLTIRNLDAGNPAVMAAAASGAVQGFALNPPRCALSAKSGFHVIANLGDDKMKYFNGGAGVTLEYLKTHRDIVTRFVRSLMQAEVMFRNDRNLAFKTIEEQDGVTDPVVKQQVFDFYKKFWADPPTVDRAGMLAAIRYSSNDDTRARGAALVDKMYDNSVVNAILKEKTR